jgi:hypothetical protein
MFLQWVVVFLKQAVCVGLAHTHTLVFATSRTFDA